MAGEASILSLAVMLNDRAVRRRRAAGCLLAAAARCPTSRPAAAAGPSAVRIRGPEYDEDIYLSLDGSATVYVNASLPALVALRGVDLDLDPAALFDRARVADIFESPGVHVVRVTTSRQHGRRVRPRPPGSG